MKKILLTSFVAVFYFGIGLAQSINFELADPHPELQDADVGDMEFADIDNDGDSDLIVIGKGGPILTTIYINDGNGNFSESNNTELVNVYGGKIGLNDIDSDGDLDLLISGISLSQASINLYLNDGTGIYSVVNSPFAPAKDGDFEFGDIDSDGDDDVIMVGTDDSNLPFTKLYKNDGAGNFSEVMSTNFIATQFGAVELFDYDNDNDLDIITIGEDIDDNKFTGLYQNDGTGEFSLVANTPFNNFDTGDIAIGDTDNDGDLDVLLCGYVGVNDIETELYLNDGTGTFSLLPNTTFSDVAIGEASFNDFDNDGDLDVFVLGSGEGGLIGPNGSNTIVGNIYENQGANNFVISDSLIGGYLSSHAVADIDGDNDLDLVLGGTTVSDPVRATWLYTNETIISSTENLEQPSIIELYPNPSTGVFNIKLNEQTNAIINVYSYLGKMVYSNNLNSDVSEIELELLKGIYILVVKTKDSLVSKKLIIQE